MVLYDAADYRRAQETLDTALDLCRAGDQPATELACVTCMVYVLRECGEWPRAPRSARELIAEDRGVWVVRGPDRRDPRAAGQARLARRLLTSASPRRAPRPLPHDAWTAPPASPASPPRRAPTTRPPRCCRSLLAQLGAQRGPPRRRHGLRWAAGFLARRGDRQGAHACAEALTRIAAATGHADALAGLALRDRRDRARRRRRGDRRRAAHPRRRAAPRPRRPVRARRDRAAGGRRARRGRRPRARARAARRRLPHRPQARRAAARHRGGAEVAALGESVDRGSGAARPPTPTAPASRAASSRSSGSSAPGARTARSPRSSSSARAPWTCTCATCCASSTSARAWTQPAGRRARAAGLRARREVVVAVGPPPSGAMPEQPACAGPRRRSVRRCPAASGSRTRRGLPSPSGSTSPSGGRRASGGQQPGVGGRVALEVLVHPGGRVPGDQVHAAPRGAESRVRDVGELVVRAAADHQLAGVDARLRCRHDAPGLPFGSGAAVYGVGDEPVVGRHAERRLGDRQRRRAPARPCTALRRARRRRSRLAL